MTLIRPGCFQWQPLDLPTPGVGQVRVRMQGCGVCASNVPPWEGRDWFNYPMEPGTPGHEGWGVVEAVGEEVTGLRVGDRVATLSQQAYATHVIAESDALVVLPRSLDGLDFPGEPLACAMNIFERSRVAPGDRVLILGVGFLGAMLVRLCHDAGAKVTAVSRRPSAQALATAAGACAVWDEAQAKHEADRVGGFFDGGAFDIVIEATGKPGPLDLASKLVAEMGRLVIAGFHQDGPRTIDLQQWNWRGLDVINAHERRPERYIHGLRRAVAAVEAGRLQVQPLITHRLPLTELNEAMRLTRDRPEGFLKAVVLMQDPDAPKPSETAGPLEAEAA